MIAVIFEVFPNPERRAEYLDMAAKMRPLVEEIEGFISVERFQSLTNPENCCRFLSSRTKRRWTDGDSFPPIAAHKKPVARLFLRTIILGLRM